MKVTLDSNLSIKNVFEPPTELQFNGDIVTLKDLLEKVNELCRGVELLKEGALGDDVRNILLNGKDYFFIPEGLNTALKEGDSVNIEIYMEPLGGG